MSHLLVTLAMLHLHRTRWSYVNATAHLQKKKRLKKNAKHSSFFEILSDWNQAVTNHLTDECQTRQPDTPPDHPQGGPVHPHNDEDGSVVYPANAFDSRLRGD